MKKQKNKVTLSSYLKECKFGIALYLFCTIIGCACDVFQVIVLGKAIEYITLGITEHIYFKSAIYAFLIDLAVVVLRRVCYYANSIIFQKCSAKITSKLNSDLAKQSFKLNSKTYSEHSTGTFLKRIVEDPESITSQLFEIVDSITSPLSVIAVLIYISLQNPFVTLALIGVIAICTVLEFIRLKVKKKKRKQVAKQSEAISSITTEIIKSEKDIKSMGLEQKLSEVSNNAYHQYRKTQCKTETVNIHFYQVRNIIIEICTVLILIMGVYFIDLGTLTLAAFMIVYSNSDSLYYLVWSLGNIGDKIVQIKISTQRMFKLFDEEEFVTEKFGTVNLDHVEGEIEFKNVSYSYKEYDYLDDDDAEQFKKKNKKSRTLVNTKSVINNLSFKIKPNTTVAFVGKSGCGKSTVLNLMSKMFEVDEGEVLIDGVNINDFNKPTLRKTISLVNQFPYIFDMTIKENLLLAKPEATDDELWAALEKAAIADYFKSLPKSIDTVVGENGIKLSGGERQRLAIARAMLRNSSIIIFDESTSSLDNFAQAHIKRSIDALKGEATIVIVAHRLSTIKDADEIFFMDEGKIIDIGTFDDLFDRNEKFRTMFLAENL